MSRSQDSYLRTGTPGEFSVSGEGGNWIIEVVDSNGVWVSAEPGFRYSTKDEAEDAMETLSEARREEREREFINGFAEGAEIRVRDAREAWAQFSRQMSDKAREAEEQQGLSRGLTLGMEYKAF